MIDSRKKELKPVDLPKDFLKILTETFNEKFVIGLKMLEKTLKNPKFISSGKIFPSEMVVGVTLTSEGTTVGNTVWSSIDFDPSQKKPTPAEALNICADVAAAVMTQLFETPDVFNAQSLTVIDNVPFDWTLIEWEKSKVFVKFDKSNPVIDKIAEDWLKKNDPHWEKYQDEDDIEDYENE